MAKLTEAQKRVVRVLWKDGGFTEEQLGKLARKADSSKEGVMRVLDNLNDKGLVQIPTGRERKFRLTAKNKRKLQKLMPELQKQATRIPIRPNPEIPLWGDRKPDFKQVVNAAASGLRRGEKNAAYKRIRDRMVEIAKKIGLKDKGYSRAVSKYVAIMNVNSNQFGRNMEVVMDSLKKDPEFTKLSMSKKPAKKQQQGRRKAAAGRRPSITVFVASGR